MTSIANDEGGASIRAKLNAALAITDALASPSANGAAIVKAADYAAIRALLGLVVGTDVQAYDSDLAAIAALATTPFGRALLTMADAAAARASFGVYSTGQVDAAIATAVTGLLDFKGATDASANPNYPAALKGDAFVVSAAGKIGGAAGLSVDVGDVFVASVDNAGGTQAAVGASWFILEHNLAGTLLAANNLSDLANTAAARGNLGLGSIAVMAEATAAEYRAATAGRALSADKVWSAAAVVALADAATIALDMATFLNGSVTLGGNRTLGNPINAKPGQSGFLRITQDGTGSRTLAYAANWKYAGGIGAVPALSTAAGAVDVLGYLVLSANEILITGIHKAVA